MYLDSMTPDAFNVQAMSDLASLPVGERVRVLGGKNFEKSGAPSRAQQRRGHNFQRSTGTFFCFETVGVDGEKIVGMKLAKENQPFNNIKQIVFCCSSLCE